jgi:FMN phosphatase YigB (HAD superfamily)
VKIFLIPERTKVLVFDIDNTLYSNSAYAAFQESSQVAKLAEHLGISLQDATNQLEKARKARKEKGLPRTSMGGHFLEFGIDMATIIRWREDAIHPAEWLKPNALLDSALGSLRLKFKLAALTNNPKSIGLGNLEALGIDKHFETVVGLDDTYRSKPEREPFLAVCAALSVRPTEAVSIGDRYDIDIEPALSVGMGGILVNGVLDVLSLPAVVGARNLCRPGPPANINVV